MRATRRAGLAVLLAALAVGVACGRPGPATPLSPAQIAERALPSVVLVRGPDRIGTGFIAGPDGRVATNLHVIYGAAALELQLPDGRVLRDLEVMAIDEGHDLAVLRARGLTLPALPLGDSNQAKAGERVVAIGHPLGLGNTVSDGLISAVRDLPNGARVLQISAPIAQGSSGGPLIDDAGKVVGVAFLVSERGQNLNFAVPVNDLKPLLAVERGMPFSEFARRTAPRQDPNAPKIVRQVPRHPVTLLDDCVADEVRNTYGAINEAIGLGAPLYNQGNHAACFKIYEGTALELEGKLIGCTGVKQALADGRARAGTMTTDTERAWAMRDAFDGLLLVIEIKAQQP